MPAKKKNPTTSTKRSPTTSTSATTSATELQLAKEVKDLSKEIRKLKDLEFVQVLNRPWKFLGLSFLKGLAVGFGSVLGATVVVALFIYLLSQISVVPIIGEFIKDVISQIQGPQ